MRSQQRSLQQSTWKGLVKLNDHSAPLYKVSPFPPLFNWMTTLYLHRAHPHSRFQSLNQTIVPFTRISWILFKNSPKRKRVLYGSVIIPWVLSKSEFSVHRFNQYNCLTSHLHSNFGSYTNITPAKHRNDPRANLLTGECLSKLDCLSQVSVGDSWESVDSERPWRVPRDDAALSSVRKGSPLLRAPPHRFAFSNTRG